MEHQEMNQQQMNDDIKARNDEIEENVVTADFRPNMTNGTADNPIYFKWFDWLTNGRAFLVKDIFAVVIEFIISFVVLFIFIGTDWFFIYPSQYLLPSFLFICLILLIMALTLIPKYDKNYLSYIWKYGSTLRLKIKPKKEDKSEYNRFARVEPNGDTIYLLVANGRMSEMLFQSDIAIEQENIALERNDLNGITVTNSKGFVDQSFKKQKEMLQEVIEKEEDEDLIVFAKKFMLGYRKKMKTEKVERQFMTFKVHNEDERNRLDKALDSWEKKNVISIDRELSELKAKEIFEEF
jgi:hypothetical protein